MAAVRTPDPRHVNPGSNCGATLPDPKKVLAGTGARIRHIKIALPEDLERLYLRNYLNLLNNPNNPTANTASTDGFLSTRNSGSAARVTQ